MMNEFSGVLDSLQDAILSLEWEQSLRQMVCECGGSEALYRCSGIDKCFFPRLRCKDCIIMDHTSLPFHRIQKWTSDHFSHCSLESLGFTLQLGHQGAPCPSSTQDGGASRELTIVHLNGYHTLPVYFCHCFDAEAEYIQLVQASLFPATITQPETAFTFGLLDEYDQHVLSSKKPSYDYHDALVKLTNPVAPQNVPVS